MRPSMLETYTIWPEPRGRIAGRKRPGDPQGAEGVELEQSFQLGQRDRLHRRAQRLARAGDQDVIRPAAVIAASTDRNRVPAVR